MAFGTFFKKILTGAKNLISKAAPIIRKGLETVSKVTPYIQNIGKAIGGPIGSTISGIAGTVGTIADKGARFMDNSGLSKGKFDVPLLKDGSG